MYYCILITTYLFNNFKEEEEEVKFIMSLNFQTTKGGKKQKYVKHCIVFLI